MPSMDNFIIKDFRMILWEIHILYVLEQRSCNNRINIFLKRIFIRFTYPYRLIWTSALEAMHMCFQMCILSNQNGHLFCKRKIDIPAQSDVYVISQEIHIIFSSIQSVMLLLLTKKTCWFWCKFQIEANDKIGPSRYLLKWTTRPAIFLTCK